MDEFELIERYFARQGELPGVITGVGDDGAVLRPDPGRELVSVVDAMVSGVHFPAGIDAADLGYRAVAVNLSDIAAMGARPRWMTLSLTLPEASPAWLEEFSAGLYEAANEHGVALVGGDTTRGSEVVVSVQITGDVESGEALLRSGARAGDTVYVTGNVGDAAAGLQLIEQDEPDEYLAQRFLRPSARVGYGRSLIGVANAVIDISDGLHGDLQKLLAASGVGAEVMLDALPLSEPLLNRFDREAALNFALSGGEDYELCFATSAMLQETENLQVTAIGKITDSQDLVLRGGNGIVAFDDSGYRHFQ